MGLFFILRFEIAFIPSLKTGAFGIIRGKSLFELERSPQGESPDRYTRLQVIVPQKDYFHNLIFGIDKVVDFGIFDSTILISSLFPKGVVDRERALKFFLNLQGYCLIFLPFPFYQN
jgi:hypothetical protein